MKKKYIPGSDWLYLKVYCNEPIGEVLLCNEIPRLLRYLIAHKYISKFFFVRFKDPYFHLRLRFLLTDIYNVAPVMHKVDAILSPLLKNHFIWDVQYDTYIREIERYHNNLIEDTESLFYVDSMHILRMLHMVKLGIVERWQLSIPLIESWFSVININTEQKKAILNEFAIWIKNEYGFTNSYSKILNNRYRIYRGKIEDLIKKREVILPSKVIKIIDNRQSMMRLILHSMRLKYDFSFSDETKNLISSYIHMSMNRLFHHNNRLYELVIYDYLKRYYNSQIAIIKSMQAQRFQAGVN